MGTATVDGRPRCAQFGEATCCDAILFGLIQMRIEVIVEVAATSSRSRKIKIKIKSVCVVEVQTDRQTDQLPFVGRAMRCDAMYGLCARIAAACVM